MVKRSVKVIISILLVYTFFHFIYSGIYKPIFVLSGPGATSQVDEEAEILKKSITSGEPITDFDLSSAGENIQVNPRQYGPIYLLVIYPAVRFFPNFFEWYLLAIGYISIIFGLYFSLKIMPTIKRAIPLMIIIWFNFSPLYHILQVKNVELLETFFISVAIFAIVNARGLLAGLMIALGSLTKFFPGMYALYFIFKERMALFWYVAIGVLILLASGFVFGPAMGISYPLEILGNNLGSQGWATSYFENNAIKGMVYKAFAGFHVAEDYFFKVDNTNAAFFVYLISSLSVFVFLCFILAKNWKKPNENLIKLGLIGPAAMLLAPLATQFYAVILLPTFSILIYLYLGKVLNKTVIALSIVSYVLIGQFLPSAVVMSLVPWDFLNKLLENTQFTLLESWEAYGMPFLGFLLLFVAFAVLLIQNAKSATFKNKQSV